MTYQYSEFGYYGSTCLREEPEPDPVVVCDLCGEDCTDDYILKQVTPARAICICGDCASQPADDLHEIIEYWKSYNNQI